MTDNIALSNESNNLNTSQGNEFGTGEQATRLQRLQEEMRAIKHELNQSLNKIGRPIRIVNKDFTIRYINSSFAEMNGITIGEAVGRKCWELFENPLCRTPKCRLNRILSGEQTIQTEIQRKTTGGMIPCIVTSVPLVSIDGELTGIMETFINITRRKQYQEQLKESEDQYHALLELDSEIGEAVVMLQDTDDKEGVQTFLNDQWPRLIGYSEKELLGMSFFELVALKDRAASLQKHRQKMSGMELPGLFEISVVHKSGIEIPVELTSAVTTYHGKPANVAYIRNITDRKRNEQKIQETASQYNALVTLGSQIGAAIMVLQDIDGIQGKHVFVSDQWVQMTGYSKEELLTMSNFDLFSPKDREFITESHKHRNEGKGTTSDLFEMTIIRKDGTEIPVESEGALTTYDGKPAVVVYMRDISERKRMETILRDSENMYRTIFETAGTAMHILEKDGTTMLVNEQFKDLYGWTRDESIGKHYTELVAPRFRERVGNYFEERSLNPNITPLRFGMQIADSKGNIKDTIVTINMIPCTDRRVISQLDITELKRFEKRLKRSQSRLRLLARRMIEAQEVERARIARELHDQLAQELVALRIETMLLANQANNTQEKVRLNKLVGSIDGLLDSVQNISVGLRPKMLDELGLLKAVQWYAEEFERRSGISCPVNIQNSRLQTLVLNKETEIEAYRIIQEALVNVLRHSKATQAKIQIKNLKKRLYISIIDNGIGMASTEFDSKTSLGILGMRERASIVGGNFRIKSISGKGTRITLGIPLS